MSAVAVFVVTNLMLLQFFNVLDGVFHVHLVTDVASTRLTRKHGVFVDCFFWALSFSSLKWRVRQCDWLLHFFLMVRSPTNCPVLDFGRLMARLLYRNDEEVTSKMAGKWEKENMDRENLRFPRPMETFSGLLDSSLAVAAAKIRSQKSDLVANDELLVVSSCFEELFGYSQDELKGKSILRLLSITGVADPRLEIYLNMVAQGLKIDAPIQVSLRRKTGELVDCSVFIEKTSPGAPGKGGKIYKSSERS